MCDGVVFYVLCLYDFLGLFLRAIYNSVSFNDYTCVIVVFATAAAVCVSNKLKEMFAKNYKMVCIND